MTEYTFTQQVIYLDIFLKAVNTLGLSTPLDHIDTLGTGPTMSLFIYFTGPLSSGDLTTLTNFVSSYVDISQTRITAMISNLSTAVQTQSNLMTLLTAKVQATLPTLSIAQLEAACTLLGITF